MLYGIFLLSLYGLVSCSTPPEYKLSSEELSAFLALRADADTSSENQDNAGVYLNGTSAASIDKRGLTVDTSAECRKQNHVDAYGFSRVYTFSAARCDSDVRPNRYKLYCNEKSIEFQFPNFKHVERRNVIFLKTCPKKLYCQNFEEPIWNEDGTRYSEDLRDIECLPLRKKKIENLEGVARRPWIHGPDVHCSKPIEVPGSGAEMTQEHWSAAGTNMILTEQLSWANGSEYKSPLLFIHDKTGRKEFDWNLKKDDSVVSAEIEVMPVRGRIPSRLIEYCMKLAHNTDVWVIMTYAWFTHPWKHRKAIPQTLGSSSTVSKKVAAAEIE